MFFSKTLGTLAVIALAQIAAADPLPSWNDTDARTRIISFVEDISDPASDKFVPTADRIAVFDNDGTLWAEQPAYFQLIFAIDRLREMAAADPSIITSDTAQAAVDGDMDTLFAGGDEALIEVVNLTHSGLPVDEFQNIVRRWLAEVRHPDTGLPYDQMTYQPMVELLRYLRDEGFTTYIVSGGGVHFMRAFTDTAYGIPNRQIIGSLGETRYEMIDGVPTITKDAGIAFIDDKDTKPVAIDRIIGQRPIFAAGNSDGDFAMVEWVTAGAGPRFGMIVHHTDGAREYAYDRDSHIGKLEKGLDEGPDMGWLIVDMAKDWAKIYTGRR
jgi:haloacid dehalogenase-like hydrolase